MAGRRKGEQMKRYPVLMLLIAAALLSMIACKDVRENVDKGTKAVKAVKKAVEAAKTTDNPLKKAQVGEFINFKMTTESMGTKTDMQMKQTVVEKDEVSVTLRTETTAMGMKMPPQDVKIMLNQPYEPYKQGLTDAVVTPIGEGNETLTVGGKSYACHWAKVKVVVSKPSEIESVTTVWTCPEVPVNGMVKMVTDSTMNAGGNTIQSKMTMELLETGK